MEQDEGVELRGRGPDRLERGIVEVLACHVRTDLCAAQSERPDGMAKLIRRQLGRLHGQRRNGEKAVGAGLHQLGELLVLDTGERRRQRRRLRVDEGLRANRQHLHVHLGCGHVLQAALQVPAAAGEMPVDTARDVERAELIVDVGELRCHLGRFALQQPDRLFGQDVSVNVDGWCGLCDHGSICS